MFTRLYLTALLVDSVLADEVLEMGNAGLITDHLAALAWWLIHQRLI